MGLSELLFGKSQDSTPTPPPAKRTNLEDIDNALRRQRQRTQATGRDSLITGLTTGAGTGLKLGGDQ